jgi:hypothetical protein
MMDELIAKIAAQTGQPVETVTPIVGALLAHLGDVLPAPLAHQLAVMLGIHQDDASQADGTGDAQPVGGGLLGSVIGSLEGQGSGGGFAGATALANVAQSLLSGYLTKR